MQSDRHDEARPGAFRRAVMRCTEALLALLIVLVFFLGFMAIISFSFPQGEGLRNLVLRGNWKPEPRTAARLEFELGEEPSEPLRFVARLDQTHRTVKNKRSDGIAWNEARSGLLLGNRDSVQTYSRSRALISFGGDSSVDLDENSLIVIRRLEQDRATRRKRAVLIVFDGALDGRSAATSSEGVPMEIVTAGGSSLNVENDMAASDFRVSVNPDRTSTFTVFSGEAEVVSGGRSVRLAPNHSVTVAGNEPPGTPRALPRPPRPGSPAGDARFVFRSMPPRVRFAWNGEGTDASGYRLAISRDAEFEEILYEARLERPEFVHGNLGPGRYYWRVASVAGWAEGTFGEARTLEMIRDAVPPSLAVTFPGPVVRGDSALLQGSAEPGSKVFVADQYVSVEPSGSFGYRMALKRGVNVVVVEAVDPAGNIAYESERIHAKY